MHNAMGLKAIKSSLIDKASKNIVNGVKKIENFKGAVHNEKLSATQNFHYSSEKFFLPLRVFVGSHN